MITKIKDILIYPIEYILSKKLKINTNTFFSYFLGILSVILAVDRLFESFFVMLTGQMAMYWSPLIYVLAYFIIVYGYSVTCGSPMCITLKHPMRFFVFYSLCFYGVAFGMVVQWVNEAVWLILMQFKNFTYIAKYMPEIIVPAVAAISIAPPFSTIRWIINYYVGNIIDGDPDWIEAFEDFRGTKLTSSKNSYKIPEAFICNSIICIDDKTGKPAIIPESKRFEATLVEGATGTGKTATIVEPMCAIDIEKKYFFRELSKKLGYNALQTGLATINVPYSNDFLNRNFNLSYLIPRENKISEYKDYIKDMLKYVDPETNEMYYRGIGFTLVAPDNACIERIRKVAEAYEIDVNVIDPMDSNSLGINPFIGTDPAKVASIISTVLKGMYESENTGGDNVFFANVTQQAFENLAILLKLVYPKMHNGEIPTLEDMLEILNNFDLAEEMCEVLKKDLELSEDYKSLIGYFEKNFYKPPVNIHGYEIASTYGSGRKETEKFVYGAITQLDNFLRNPGIKRVLCSRNNNIDLDKALKEGQIITACTRQGNLGEIHQKAFGMFVILSFKDAVLRRPGVEDSRTPHFIYIDEFPLYVNKDTEAFFTLFRKYRCGTLITIQNLSQLTKSKSLAYFKDVIITNTKTQIIFGDMTVEESKFWSEEMGTKKKWKYSKTLADTNTEEGQNKVTQAWMNASREYPPNYKPDKIVQLKFKTCIYKTKTSSGRTIIGRGATDFINKKYYEPHTSAKYNFELFIKNMSTLKTTTNTNEDFFSGSDNINITPSYSDDSIIDLNKEPVITKKEVESSVLNSSKYSSNADSNPHGMTLQEEILIDINIDKSNESSPVIKSNTATCGDDKNNIEDNALIIKNDSSNISLDLSQISDIDSVILDLKKDDQDNQ